jgi:hypothetical protein
MEPYQPFELKESHPGRAKGKEDDEGESHADAMGNDHLFRGIFGGT